MKMKPEKPTVCATCGADALAYGIRDISQTYKGRLNMIRRVAALHCASCGESEMQLADAESSRVSEERAAFIRQVNGELASADFIVAVRKKLGLSQKRAGELFGGGHNGFSRYESGRAVPPVGLVALLIILDNHPDLLSEVPGEGHTGAPPA